MPHRQTSPPLLDLARSRRGAIAILFAILLPVLILSAGLMLDTVTWYREQARLQFCADASAVAAGFLVISSHQATDAQGIAALQAVGTEAIADASAQGNFLGSSMSSVIQVQGCSASTGLPYCSNGGAGSTKIQATLTSAITSQATQFFTGFVAGVLPMLTVNATVAIKQHPCIIALNNSNVGTPLYGIYAQNGASVTGTNCGVVSDSIASGSAPAISTVAYGDSGLEGIINTLSSSLQTQLGSLITYLEVELSLPTSSGRISGSYVSAAGSIAIPVDSTTTPFPLSKQATQPDPLAGLEPIIPNGCAFFPLLYSGSPMAGPLSILGTVILTTTNFAANTNTFCGNTTLLVGVNYVFQSGQTYFFRGDLTMLSASITVAGGGGITFVVLGNIYDIVGLGGKITLLSNATGVAPANGSPNGATNVAVGTTVSNADSTACGVVLVPLPKASTCATASPAIPGIAIWQPCNQSSQVFDVGGALLLGINQSSVTTTGLIEAPCALMAVWGASVIGPPSTGALTVVASSIVTTDAGTAVIGTAASSNTPLALVQ